MWQRLQDLLNPMSPAERERFLEKRAEQAEKDAEAAERRAKLRARISAANMRAKDVQPPQSKWALVGGVIALILILILLAQMC